MIVQKVLAQRHIKKKNNSNFNAMLPRRFHDFSSITMEITEEFIFFLWRLL